MPRYERFTFLCNQNERQLIAVLAAHLQRSQSDTVRFVVIEAARQLLPYDAQPVASISVQSQKAEKK